MQEDSLLDIIMKQESWEELINNIVSLEGMDPKDIDLIKLTDSFLKYIEKIEKLDFRIPAKVVLVATILLKMKADILNPILRMGGDEYFVDQVSWDIDEFEGIRKKLSEIEFRPAIRRLVKRKVTLDELIGALNKAVKVKERRETKKRRLGKRIRRNIDLQEEDIEKRIDSLLNDIEGLLLSLKSEKVEFSKIVKTWNRDEVVRAFLPVLHLSARGVLETEQEEFFKEIFISRKN